MKIDILTLFPEMFVGPFATSMLKKAQDNNIVKIKIHNLRNWATDKHKSVDDRPYGGGAGMVLRVDVIDYALNDLRSKKKIPQKVRSSQLAKSKRDDKASLESLLALSKTNQPHIVLLSAKGNKYNQQKAQDLSKLDHLILIAGHYEDVDQRVVDHLVDEEISIGDFVLTGGEIPAMAVVDSIVRLLPNVLGAENGLTEESHSAPGYIEYPHYTRPEVYRGWKVPEVLLNGNHAEIEKWKKENSPRRSTP